MSSIHPSRDTNTTKIPLSPAINCGSPTWPSFDKHSFLIQSHYLECLTKILIPNGLILNRVEKLAFDYYNYHIKDTSKPIVALCVLKGANQFFNDFIGELKKLVVRDNKFYNKQPTENKENTRNYGSNNSSIIILPEFISVSSYSGTETLGKVKIQGLKNMEKSFNNKNVLIVEDIIDTGLTMKNLIKTIEEYKPESVKVATLFLKNTPKAIPDRPVPDLTGFEIGNEFIVGYGIDYNEMFRDMDHVGVINDVGIERFKVAE